MRSSTGTRFGQRRTAAPVTELALFLLIIAVPTLQAQQANETSPSDKETIQTLVQQIQQLQARVQKLESEKQSGAVPQPPEQAVQTAAQTSPESQVMDHGEADHMDTGKTLMQIRGFGDVTFHGDTAPGDTTAFTLGQLDLFVTSDVSEKFKFLSEIVFEADSRNSYGVDVERLLLQYTPNDYLNVSVGRFHTAIGYYNTAYHHSTWLQTATGRPFLFEFEDKGGILPVHSVGISATGLIPSGPLGLHYVAEVGNGRSSRDPAVQEPVQNVIDENNRKAVNFGLYARPQVLRGLQAGVSVYHDLLSPIDLPRIGETIIDGHAIIVRPAFEWLNEGVIIRHAVHGGRTFNTPAFYTQLSRRFGPYRPYFRYQYLNVANTEPVFSFVGLRQGPSVGIRFDPTESVALKFQYDYTGLRNKSGVNGLTSQLAFTF